VSVLKEIVLGVVQGLTEFLPISSTAHLRIVPALLGWEDPGAAYTAVVQLGTTAAVLIYFRTDLWRIGRAWFASLTDASRRREHDARLGWFIVFGTIPIGIFGLAFKDQIEHGARDLYLIATMLIVVGLVLLAAERVSRRERDIEQLDAGDATAIGLAQALALVPGTSRSGATIAAGLFRGLTREAAARYSFLLSTPAIVLAALLELSSILGGKEHEAGSVRGLAIATLMAFIVGYVSIAFLLRFLVRHTTVVFVVYRLALGALVLSLTAGGAIK
jgi:undecaprenyl-diphosphatase